MNYKELIVKYKIRDLFKKEKRRIWVSLSRPKRSRPGPLEMEKMSGWAFGKRVFIEADEATCKRIIEWFGDWFDRDSIKSDRNTLQLSESEELKLKTYSRPSTRGLITKE